MATYHFAARPVYLGYAQAASAYRRRTDRHALRGGYEGGGTIGWTGDARDLWRAAETADTPKRRQLEKHRPQRRQVAMAITVALPHELGFEDRLRLVRGFCLGLRDRWGLAAQFDLHEAHNDGDTRNVHAHILLTTRAVDEAGRFGAKIRPLSQKAVIKDLRLAWEERVNGALARAGRPERVSSARRPEKEAREHLARGVFAKRRREGRPILSPALAEAQALKARADLAAAEAALRAADRERAMVERAASLWAQGTPTRPAASAPAGPMPPAVRKRTEEQR